MKMFEWKFTFSDVGIRPGNKNNLIPWKTNFMDIYMQMVIEQCNIHICWGCHVILFIWLKKGARSTTVMLKSLSKIHQNFEFIKSLKKFMLLIKICISFTKGYKRYLVYQVNMPITKDQIDTCFKCFKIGKWQKWK